MLDSDEQQNVTQLLVYLLPACNSDTLHRLLEFLSTVTDHAHDRQDKDGHEVSANFDEQEIWLKRKILHHILDLKRSSLEDLVSSSGEVADFCFPVD